MSITQVLRHSVLFRNLDDVQLSRVADIARREKHPAEAVVFGKGDKIEDLYIVERGSVRLTMDVHLWNSPGTLRTVVEILVEGNAFGWSSLVEPNVATLAAHTKEPCALIAVGSRDLRKLMDEDPLMGYRVMQALSRLIASRLHATRASIMSLRAQDVSSLPVSALW